MASWIQRGALLAGAVVTPLLVIAACDEERCNRHSDCAPPSVCVESACWVALCSPEDPTCPAGTTCESGYCHAGSADGGPDATPDAGGDASSDGGARGGDEPRDDKP